MITTICLVNICHHTVTHFFCYENNPHLPPAPCYWTCLNLFSPLLPLEALILVGLQIAHYACRIYFFHFHAFPDAFNPTSIPCWKCSIQYSFDLFKFPFPSVNFAEASPTPHLSDSSFSEPLSHLVSCVMWFSVAETTRHSLSTWPVGT